MLPKIKMVRDALNSLHTSTCVIYTYEDESIDEDTGIVRQGKQVMTEYPCRVSYKSATPTTGDKIATATQTVTLFLDPDIEIPVGCDIDVRQNGRCLQFKASGIPLVYQSHQEVSLEERVKYHG